MENPDGFLIGECAVVTAWGGAEIPPSRLPGSPGLLLSSPGGLVSEPLFFSSTRLPPGNSGSWKRKKRQRFHNQGGNFICIRYAIFQRLVPLTQIVLKGSLCGKLVSR